MRIICTLNDQKQAHQLSSFLAREGIDNQLEMITNTDWGAANYGDTTCRIWVYDEDQVDGAMRWVEMFQNDPNNPIFKTTEPQMPITPVVLPPQREPQMQGSNQSIGRPQEAIRTPITTYLIWICAILFFIDSTTTPMVTNIPSYLPPTPILSSPLKKQTLYDYPQAYEIVDKLVKLYGIEKLQSPQDLPQEGQYLLRKFHDTPYWQGFYDEFLKAEDHKQETHAPLFEKIKQGEAWRLFSPCLMHNDILHILFNMLWLIVLGKQIEQRLAPRRYILLLLITGIFSNTCQYLMGGPNFIGFSGILCGMLTFIWMRQKKFPWEAYPLDKSTIAFLLIFILAMFVLQVVSFYLEAHHKMSISPGIANTGHLSGALLGLLLGRLTYFSWKAR